MILRPLCRAALSSPLALLLLLLLVASPQPASAKKDHPTIASTKFKDPLENLFYFDDSNVILGHDKETGTVWRSKNAGESWYKVDSDGQAGNVWDLWPHPFDNQRAYLLGVGHEHWITTDQGESWRRFNSETGLAMFRSSPLAFHGRTPEKVIWNGEECLGLACAEVALYTDDDFKTVHRLGSMTRGCQWAVGSPDYAPDAPAEVDDRIFCIVEGLYSPWPKDNRLIFSDDFFDRHEIEPVLDDGRAVTGIISMAAVKGFLVAAAKSEGTDELALYVTKDAAQWHRAEFGQHRVDEDAYTILESTNYSLQVDVLGSRPSNPMGFLFTSNSNGTYFTRNIDHTNRNAYGRVDFEKIQGIQGIVLVNVVDNWKEVDASTLADKQIETKISFDDGRTFQYMLVDGEHLHLHSVTDAKQGGRIFSSPAPGIVMGVGNPGKYLRDYYKDGDLFVSDDAGVTWRKALDGPHLYEFGNKGAVIAAIKHDNDDDTSHLYYSINHGKDWDKVDLDVKIRPQFLTTVPDSTTLRFLLMGTHGEGSKTEWLVFQIDFEGLHERTCKKDDLERWPARVDEDGKPSCIMGHKQFFMRRKPDAECFFDDDFEDPVPEFEPCTCTRDDFECDYNFVRDAEDRSICKPAGPLPVADDKCKSEKDTYRGPSGWRLIPGNDCDRKGGVELDKDIDRACSEAPKKPETGDVAVEKTKFDTDQFAEWYYLSRSDTSRGSDESIVMRTSDQRIYLTHDHGKTWNPILEKESIRAIAPNPGFHDAIYFLTDSDTVHYTIDRGDKFHQFETPKPPSTLRGVNTLRFHPNYKDWLLWHGQVDDHTNVWYSKDRGDTWNILARATRKCEFIPRDRTVDERNDQMVYCEQYADENPDKSLMLKSSTNFFDDEKIHFPDILDFAIMSEFIIVAAKAEDKQGLKVDASVDGKTFAAAEFPRNFQVDHQQAYTVLDSSTHAVFLHVTVSTARDREFGTIIKSNSNGTSYVLTIGGVNQNSAGYVDFEKMQGLEGVAMVNVVSNTKAKDSEPKKLKSMITHNDAAEWALIPPPKKDVDGKDYKCVGTANVATQKCSLHLHSYTERMDKSATFSSPSAVGLMLAVGNVGEFLLPKSDGATDTFITRDAGITWVSVKKGSWLWEYGDQGSIIVIVPESRPTKSIFYTLDEGIEWREFRFTEVEMQIDAITTVPSDTSKNFLLWGRELGDGAKSGVFTVNLDFTNIKERQRKCDLDEQHPVNGDYLLWEPKHPMQDSNCLFGHVAQYHRKRVEADCYNGKIIEHLHNIETNCTCTRQDFECDYNYQMQADGTCKLVEGLKPADHSAVCRDDPERVEYFEPTGYRRVPLSTCQGGRELDKLESKPCPGHEGEYEKKHGLSGLGLFFAIVIPVCAAAGVGYWVYTRWQQHGFGNFGQIRLGESLGDGNGESAWITVPVAIVSAVVAVAKTIPMVVTTLWRSLRGYMPLGGGGGGGGGGGRFGVGRGSAYGGAPYRSRDAFASRQADYSSVVEDDELLGAGDDDEEV